MSTVVHSSLRIYRSRQYSVARIAERWLYSHRDNERDNGAADRRSATSRAAAPRSERRARAVVDDADPDPPRSREESSGRRRKGPYFRGVEHIKRDYLAALSSTAPSAAASTGASSLKPPVRRRVEPRWSSQVRTAQPSNQTHQWTSRLEERALPPPNSAKPPSSYTKPLSLQNDHRTSFQYSATKRESSFTNPFEFINSTAATPPSRMAGDESISIRHGRQEKEPSLFAEDNIFDVFRVKDEEISNNTESLRNQKSGAFGSVAFRKYSDLVQRVVSPSDRLKRKHTSKPIPDKNFESVLFWLQSDIAVVTPELPSLEEAIRDGLSPVRASSVSSTESTGDWDSAVSERRSGHSFRTEVEAQRERFLQAVGWNRHQHQLAQNALFLMANACAKELIGQPVQVIWEKVKEAGLFNEKLLHVLLYVSAMFSSTGLAPSLRSGDRSSLLQGAGSILDVLGTGTHAVFDDGPSEDVEGAQAEQLDEIALYHDLLYEPTEQTINVRVRLLTAQGKVKEAEALIREYADKMEVRLRTCTPVLLQLLDIQDFDSALRLLRVMQKSPSVHLDAATYVNVLASLARSGVFGPTAAPIESASSLGYEGPCGPDLLNHLVEEMSREIMEIPLESAKRLHEAFAEGFSESGQTMERSLLPLTRLSHRAPDGTLVASRVYVDPSTGKCAGSGVKLRLIQLTSAERLKLKETVISMAREGQVRFEQTLSPPLKKMARKKSVDEELQRFFEWLDQRDGEPFTVVVDAANVAYYLQNFDEGRFSFHQIQFVVDALERLGERPLVILPNKYSLPYFYVTIGIGSAREPQKQESTPEELDILKGLRDSDKLYVVPPGCLDDYFWIIASVSEQMKSRKGADLQVEAGDSMRWPGTRPVLVSNDQMRDHKLEMLEPVLFRRWYSNFIVNYAFSGFIGGTRTSAEIGFSPANFYSREIQGNADAKGSTVWHFPLEDLPDEWFCLRLPADSDRLHIKGQTSGM